MADYNTLGRTGSSAGNAQIDTGLRSHMNKVYGTMSVGMIITALAAWAVSGLAVSSVPTEYMLSEGQYLTAFGAAIYASPLKWVVMFAPLVFVFGISAGINRMSAGTAQTLFYAFAAVMGVSISSIFLLFTGASIVQIFFATSVAFAGLSLWGYTTHKDLSGWGTFLIMGVIGLIIASIINIFLASPAIMFAVSAIGVLIFAALTAYDTQNIKNTYLQMRAAEGEDYVGRAAILGALSLYLNFINMFMMLLSLFGNRQ